MHSALTFSHICSKSPTTTRGALGQTHCNTTWCFPQARIALKKKNLPSYMFLKLRVQITLKELAAKVCLMTPKKTNKTGLLQV